MKIDTIKARLELNELVSTLKEYLFFLYDNELENNLESIDLFISYMHWDILNEAGPERTPLIENKIERILKRHYNFNWGGKTWKHGKKYFQLLDQ